MIAAALALAWVLATAEPPQFEGLRPIDETRYSCPCDFGRSVPGEREGSYGSGPRVLFIDHNGSPPTALVNLGGDNVSLPVLPGATLENYACDAGKEWKTLWGSPELQLRVELEVVGPGYETCWFTGAMAGRSPATAWRILVKGACGC